MGTLLSILRHQEEGGAALPLVSAGLLAMSTAPIVVYLIMMYTNPVPNWLLYTCMFGVFLAIICIDLTGQSSPPNGERWPFFVILLDMSLVLGLPRRFSLLLVGVSIVWLYMVNVESAVRFGLFDFPGTPSASFRKERLESWIDCEEPPCKTAVAGALGRATTSALVFLLDFMITRGFAEEMAREKSSMDHTVDTVQKVAYFLAQYDLIRVTALLEEERRSIPNEIHTALHAVADNLRLYQPYLPKSCLPFEDSTTQRAQQSHSSTTGDARSATPQLAHLTVTEAWKSTSFSSHARSPARKVSEGEGSDPRRDLPGTLTPPFRAFLSSPVVGRRIGSPEWKNITLMNLNTQNTLSMLHDDPKVFGQFFVTLLESSLAAVSNRAGVVDTFLGDKVLSSFNASRKCVVHSSAAIASARQLHEMFSGCTLFIETPTRVKVNGSICTGKALVGDMGCSEMRCFSVLGELPMESGGMERAGRVLGCSLVCNTLTHTDAQYLHEIKMLPRFVSFVRRVTLSGEPEPQNYVCPDGYIYEVLLDAAEGQASDGVRSGGLEWMYAMEHSGANLWGVYNTAIKEYLRGASWDTACTLMQGNPTLVEAHLMHSAVASHSHLLVHV